MSPSQQTLLVTGASGQLGRRVVELLIEASAGHIIATTRSPEKLADLAARGVEVRQADFDQPDSLVAAFAGADRLLLISTDAVVEPGQRLRQHQAAIAASVVAGVKHVLYTSATRATDSGHPALVAPDHRGAEEALAASPLGWTILRNNIYTDMLLMNLPHAIARGQLVSAAGEGGFGYITREDCARAAAAALAATTTGRTTLEITGPAIITHADVARIASEVSGKPVQYVAVSAEQMYAALTNTGLPAIYADLLVSMDTAAAQGYWNVATNVVTELTGIAPQRVRDFLAAHRDVLLASQG